ncbi:MAG: insulinase family protein [Holosporaceae bacterium]|nr:insulinase family protein [Holosporaceae bacterium]
MSRVDYRNNDKRRACVASIILTLLVCFSAYCDEKPEKESASKISQEKDEKKSEPTELVSPRGIKFWHMKDESAPLVHVRIAFKHAGSACQKQEKAGVPFFYSIAVFCGCGKYSKTQFAKECSNLASRISCEAGFDNIRFSMTAPKIVLDKTVDLFNASLTSPNFEEDKVKIIQNDVAYSMQNYAAEPFQVAFSSIIPSIIFGSHPYRNGKLGSPENFLKLSTNDLRNYKEKFLTTSRAEVCIFGDVSEDEAKSLIDRIFTNIPTGESVKISEQYVSPTLNPEIRKYYAEGQQSSIFFILKTERPLSKKRYAAEILYRILGEGYNFKGLILSKLRTENGLVYGGGITSVDLEHSSYMFGILQTDNSKVQAAIDLLKKIIKDLKVNGINEKELQFAKNNIKGNLMVRLRTSDDLCSFYFRKKLQGFGANALEDEIKKIDSVKLEEVNAFARKTLNENTLFIVIGGEKTS